MEVKMFMNHSVTEAEKLLNEWLSQNKVDVQYVGQSQCEQNGRFVFIVSLFYLRK